MSLHYNISFNVFIFFFLCIANGNLIFYLLSLQFHFDLLKMYTVEHFLFFWGFSRYCPPSSNCGDVLSSPSYCVVLEAQLGGSCFELSMVAVV